MADKNQGASGGERDRAGDQAVLEHLLRRSPPPGGEGSGGALAPAPADLEAFLAWRATQPPPDLDQARRAWGSALLILEVTLTDPSAHLPDEIVRALEERGAWLDDPGPRGAGAALRAAFDVSTGDLGAPPWRRDRLLSLTRWLHERLWAMPGVIAILTVGRGLIGRDGPQGAAVEVSHRAMRGLQQPGIYVCEDVAVTLEPLWEIRPEPLRPPTHAAPEPWGAEPLRSRLYRLPPPATLPAASAAHRPPHRPEAGRPCPFRHPLLDAAVGELAAGRPEHAEALLQRLGQLPDLGEAALEIKVRLGQTQRLASRREDALTTLEAARERALLIGRADLAAACERELACVDLDLGRADEALTRLDHAVDLMGPAPDPADLARVAFHRASAHRQRVAFGDAIGALTFAERTAAQVYDARLRGACLRELASIYLDLGRFDKARALLLRTVDLFLEQPWPAGRMDAHEALGNLALEEGDVERAVDHFRAQKQLARSLSDAAGGARARAGVAEALELAGRRDEAVAELDAACHELEDRGSPLAIHLQAELARLTALQGDGDLAARRLPSGRGAAVPVAIQARVALARGTVGAAAGDPLAARAFREGREAVDAARGMPPRGKGVCLQRTYRALCDGWIRCQVSGQAEAAAILEAVEHPRAGAFIDALLAADPSEGLATAQLRPPRLPRHPPDEPAEETLTRLPDDVSVLELHCLEDTLLALWLTRGDVQHRALPVNRRELEQLVKAHWSSLAGAEVTPRGQRRSAAAIAEVVLAPLADWLGSLSEADHLGIIPHGPLHGLPFHALPLPGEADVPLIARQPIFYAPSLRAVGGWLSRTAPEGRGLLCLGDPFGDLPGAAAEAAVVRGLLGGEAARVGEAASVDALLAQGARAALLHISTATPRRGGGTARELRLWPPSLPWDALLNPGAHGETPEGLGPGAISRLDIVADLVSISPHAGAQRDGPWDDGGPDLLAWAFLEAGARTVVAGAWPEGTGDPSPVVEDFFARVASGEPRARALALAQRAAAARPGAIARHWAGLRLTGDWRGGLAPSGPAEVSSAVP